MISLIIRAEFSDEHAARSVMEAVRPDNGSFVESSLEGRALVLRMEASSAGTLRNTMDDLMACIKAAEDAIDAGLRPYPINTQSL
ncbi:MAG: hypothetical protein IKH98_00815 [Candidatus Methanomethylophilaceae archaeon]|nr:hypothetical protein [Candidatus Methanomethylophilaceae archaeon]